eukprot:4885443-Amphidinium_carterae.1
MDADACKHLSELEGLTSLTIGKRNKVMSVAFTIGDENKIGPEGCEQLGRLRNLTSLVIGDRSDIRTVGCQHLGQLLKLTNLTIG